MDLKPLITYTGSLHLFGGLETHLVNGIPLESIEWRRSYGRPPKTVTLEADFIQFSVEKSFKNHDRRLIGLPVLHTYWTDCPDLDYYKNEVKEDIGQWMNHLKTQNNPDWLVVVMEGSDSRKSNKLLPRATVFDKIRSDFASKHPERCVSISDPSKSDARTAEAWQTLLFRIRQLSLAGLTRILTKFEEEMRGQRERRVDPSWEFCQYFLMQEELALVYEMLGLDEDALVQYDELDALFTQFIINAGAGDIPNWMHSFAQPPENWDGVRLGGIRRITAKRRGGNLSPSSPVRLRNQESARRFLEGVRTDIVENDVSLLQFRNYLFSRQCSLLLGLGRPWEVAQRTLPFLQTCRQELHVLKLTMPPGSLACWGVLSVLELLTVCQSCCDDDLTLAESLSKHIAPLWSFAKEQLLELGQLCGLMPDTKSGPSSQQLHIVVSLIGGISDEDSFESNSPPSQRLSPQDRLKEAISSKEGFQRHYLELCELAMGTYKHVGRLRAAREIGLDLANFYLLMKQPARAMPFFVEACSGYSREGWHRLSTDARLKVAVCAKAVGDYPRYLKTLVLLACSSTLNEEERLRFQKEILSVLPKVSVDDEVSVKAGDVLEVESLKILHEFCRDGREDKFGGKLVADSEARAEMMLRTRFPAPLVADKVVLKLRHRGTMASENTRSGHASAEKHGHPAFGRERKGSHSSPNQSPATSLTPGSGDMDQEENWMGRVSLETFQLNMVENFEYKLDKTISVAGVGCQNFQRLIKRKDTISPKARLTSTSSNPLPEQDISELESSTVKFVPGKSTYVLVSAKLGSKGRYVGYEIVVSLFSGKLRLVYAPSFPFVSFSVFSEPASVTVAPATRDLMAGLEETFCVLVKSGTLNIPEGEKIVLKPTRGLELRLPSQTKFSDGVTLELPGMKPFCEAQFEVEAFCCLNSSGREGTLSIPHKIAVDAKWSEPCDDLELFFDRPFSFEHRILTACDKKFVRVGLRATRDVMFAVSRHSLKVMSGSPGLHDCLRMLNPVAEVLKVTKDFGANYVWELDLSRASGNAIGSKLVLEFSADFRLDSESGQSKRCDHVFELTNFRTLYAVRSVVEPVKGSEFCRAGAMCVMNVHIHPLFDPGHQQQKSSNNNDSNPDPPRNLMYEILMDPGSWAPNGRTSNVVTFDATRRDFDASVELMPLRGGSHALPTVRVSKYTSDGVAHARVEPFAVGQVYDFSRGATVQVLPPAAHHRQPSGSNSAHSSLEAFG